MSQKLMVSLTKQNSTTKIKNGPINPSVGPKIQFPLKTTPFSLSSLVWSIEFYNRNTRRKHFPPEKRNLRERKRKKEKMEMATRTDNRADRRRRIMSREMDRMALITGKLRTLPPSPPPSPSSPSPFLLHQSHHRGHSHTGISPSFFAKELYKNPDSVPIAHIPGILQFCIIMFCFSSLQSHRNIFLHFAIRLLGFLPVSFFFYMFRFVIFLCNCDLEADFPQVFGLILINLCSSFGDKIIIA